jgi:hypothetical protein
MDIPAHKGGFLQATSSAGFEAANMFASTP